MRSTFTAPEADIYLRTAIATAENGATIKVTMCNKLHQNTIYAYFMWYQRVARINKHGMSVHITVGENPYARY